jgi:hypothetical protein
MAVKRYRKGQGGEYKESLCEVVPEVQPLVGCKGCGTVFIREILPLGVDKFMSELYGKEVQSCYCPVCRIILTCDS